MLESIEKDCFVTGLSFDELISPFISKIEEEGLSPDYSIDKDKTARFIGKVSALFDSKATEELLSHYRLNEWLGDKLASERLISFSDKNTYAEAYLHAIENEQDLEKRSRLISRAEELKNIFVLHNIKDSDLKKMASFIKEMSKDVEGTPTFTAPAI